MTEPLTITDAAPLIRNGELTPSELLEQCLRRIDIYEPSVQAWVYLDRERARRDAAQLTDEVKQQYRGPLHGIPIGIKDIIDVFDMPTGCGSKLWANSYARRDATVVERLRAAGAIILGKTVTTPYAFLDPPKTRNPWNLDRTPGGSSSGSAAAVACGMCLGALGTQTGGSLTRPASYCGVCSLKPTYGRVSVDGVLPLAPSLDHVGVMANCVRDLAIVFEVIAGADPRDSQSSTRDVPDCHRKIQQLFDSSTRDVPDCHRKIQQLFDSATSSGRLLRPGFVVPQSFYMPHVSEEVGKFMLRVANDIASLADLDGFCRRIALPVGFNHIHLQHRTIMAVESAQIHSARMERNPTEYPDRIRELVEDGLERSAVEYRNARIFRDALDAECQELAWPEPILMPATVDEAPVVDTTGNPWCNSPWSFLGMPTVSLPIQLSKNGLPLAVQVIGAAWHEDSILAASAKLESAFKPMHNDCQHTLPPMPSRNP